MNRISSFLTAHPTTNDFLETQSIALDFGQYEKGATNGWHGEHEYGHMAAPRTDVCEHTRNSDNDRWHLKDWQNEQHF